MSSKPENILKNHDDHETIESVDASLSRRQFLKSTMYGSAMAMAGGALTLSPIAYGANVGPIQAYPFGTKPIATDIKGATEFWLNALRNAVPDTSPDVVLTADEIRLLKAQNFKVGHSWYGLFIPAVKGMNRFWGQNVDKWASNKTVFDVEGKPERDVAGIQLMINQKVPVMGTLSVDWVVFGEAMRKLHAANLASTSVINPASAYYPTTSSIMPDHIENGRSIVLPMAKKLRSEGITETEVVLLRSKNPTFYDVARSIGFKEGLLLPEVQAICRMRIVAERECAPGVEDAVAVTAAAMRQFPKAHVIAALDYRHAGASAAVRDAGRKDVWVMAIDLDDANVTDLLAGGWPVYVTYSLPIAQLSKAEANVMGKILLGKRVPLVVKSLGTVTTADNIKQAWARDWGGDKFPY